MRSLRLTLGVGLLAIGLLGWAQPKMTVPEALAEIALQPASGVLIGFPAVGTAALRSQDALGPAEPAKPKSPPGQATRGGPKGNKLAKVTICHHSHAAERASHTITVNEHAWKAHEQHGDSRGSC